MTETSEDLKPIGADEIKQRIADVLRVDYRAAAGKALSNDDPTAKHPSTIADFFKILPEDKEFVLIFSDGEERPLLSNGENRQPFYVMSNLVAYYDEDYDIISPREGFAEKLYCRGEHNPTGFCYGLYCGTEW